MNQKHSEVEKYITHCGTGFIKGIGIGQEILGSKTFNPMNGSQPTGYVHTGVGYICPNPMECVGVRILLS